MKSRIATPLGKTTVILGAGATRGNSMHRDPDWPLPPLNTDFFTQIQRIKNDKHQAYVSQLIRSCHKSFGTGWSLTMEDYFNHIWYGPYFGARRDTGSFRIPRMKKGNLVFTRRTIPYILLFKQVLLAVLEESLFGLHSQDCMSKTCSYHDALAAHAEPQDSFISFNYDCVIDSSLTKNCEFWNPTKSYGMDCQNDDGLKFWAGRNSDLRNNKLVFLYKLHGSINWRKEATDEVHLLQRPYTRQAGNRNFYIVPPSFGKEFHVRRVLWKIWRSASYRLATSDSVIVLGYSMPASDTMAIELFRSRMNHENSETPSPHPLRYLIIADPSRSIRHHVINIFKKSIGENTRVLVFDGIREAKEYLFDSSFPVRDSKDFLSKKIKRHLYNKQLLQQLGRVDS